MVHYDTLHNSVSRGVV